ncbi:lipid kinase, YegS/Rv2252/BmrU family [Pilibacter termitis]|uniref:Lipid kinase, YegS/Rv2252/BmrU family n=1 Tax=Pilibacter termitis TaxID=263852 RepID=A0A1T4RFD3_9ENTE|nr:diacylglycerol kinase family protein [Pilibacter termitis]SKA14516.1 lipid kinase, YegS/Rv2252/BmrU family [Pilibacter termitis]
MYHIIINTNAGSGNGKRIGEELLQYLDEKNVLYTAYFTHFAGEEVEITERLAEKGELREWQGEEENFPLLVVLGGDGTLHQVLNALDKTSKKIPVAYIPAGSGNDFARGVGIVRNDTKKAFEQIVQAKKPQKIQVLRYFERVKQEKGVAVNNFGVGIDAAIVASTNQSVSKKALNKYKLGSFSYIFSILKVLFTQKSYPAEVIADGKKHEFPNTFLATVTNHAYFGGGVSICPPADVRSEKVDLVLIEKENWLVIFWLLSLIFRGKHLKSKYVHHFKCETLQLEAKEEQFGQIDGETVKPRKFALNFVSESRLFWFL